jgi:uncharacterized protein YuzE
MRVRYDFKTDSIQIVVREGEGFLRKTGSPFVMEKVDEDDKIIAVSILKVSSLKSQGDNIGLADLSGPKWTDFRLWYEVK